MVTAVWWLAASWLAGWLALKPQDVLIPPMDLQGFNHAHRPLSTFPSSTESLIWPLDPYAHTHIRTLDAHRRPKIFRYVYVWLGSIISAQIRGNLRPDFTPQSTRLARGVGLEGCRLGKSSEDFNSMDSIDSMDQTD